MRDNQFQNTAEPGWWHDVATVETGYIAVIGNNAPVGPDNVPDIAGKSQLYNGDRRWRHNLMLITDNLKNRYTYT
jgi:hypothetical protein